MRTDAADGFSLVETLVALAVIAMSSGLLFEAVSTNLHLSRAITARRQAVLLAQSLLAAATAPSDIRNLADRGASSGLGWRITRARSGGGARDGDVPLEEIRIEVVERETGRRLAGVRTLRLAH